MGIKPILFSGEMVRAIKSGNKTMTRREVEPRFTDSGLLGKDYWFYGKTFKNKPDIGISWHKSEPIPKAVLQKAPYQVGDILWVRETWAYISDWTCVDESVGMPNGYIYRADWQNDEHPEWKPSIFMPKSAARIFLRVTDVRVERLQDITGKDAESEGAFEIHNQLIREHAETYNSIGKAEFKKLWDSINGKKSGYTWCDNPFVWIYEFKKTYCPWGEDCYE